MSDSRPAGHGSIHWTTATLSPLEAERDQLRAENERLREFEGIGSKEAVDRVIGLLELRDELQGENALLRSCVREAFEHIDTQYGPPGSNNLARPLLDKLRILARLEAEEGQR